MHFFWFYIEKVILGADFETNPGPQSTRCQEFLICNWSLNSISTQFYQSFTPKVVYYYLQLRRHLLVIDFSVQVYHLVITLSQDMT